MSKITDIENAIIQLGAGEFQKFCDTFLSKMNKYGAILGLGMKSGTLKTTKGNPDTYFVRENGKYVFVAYTTQKDSIFEKIKKDIEKCLDPNKTGVELADIEEIVCCHTSSNLYAGDDQKLHEICSDKGILLTIFGVDEIAQQIYRNYPIIARDFLGISIDTNQIMSVDDFVKLYDASETVAPLDTVFQNRVNELSELKDDIRDNKIVVHGSAGVGKTRIVLEAVKTVAREDGYKLLCVKSNNLPLYDDLIANTDRQGKYLFFIDDANELSGLNLILDFAINGETGYQIKIIMTVRDYTKESVVRECAKRVTPCLYELSGFSDEEIKDFLNVNMQIINGQFVDTIIKIAEGNPRIAYMAGKLAKETQSLAAVHDATQVYEQYYASIINTKLGDNKNLCLTAGILALVKAVMLDNLEYLEPILKIGKISKDEFVECIRQLSAMEVVEIHGDKVATISDQCLANYMLYYEFFSQKRIMFSEVLKVGFLHFRNGVIQSVNTLLNLFAKKDLQAYIEAEVAKTWDEFKQDNETCFEAFARVFHVFRPEEAFIIASEKIERIPEEEATDGNVDFEKGTFKSGDDILEFLTGFNYTYHFETVLELLLSYVQKSADNAIIGFSWLKNSYGVDSDSYRYEYWTEKKIAQKLADYVGGSNLTKKFILAYINYALSFEFRPTEAGRGNTIRIFDIELVNSKGVREYRAECWRVLKVLSEDNTLQSDVLGVLKKYSCSVRSAEDTSIVADDRPYILDIMLSFNCTNFTKALLLRNLQHGWKKLGVENEKENFLFLSEEWKLYELLEDNWMYSGLEYDEYEKQRDEQLIKYADNLDINSVSNFIRLVAAIIGEIDSRSKYSVVRGTETIIYRICESSGLAWGAYNAILCDGTAIGIQPYSVLKPLFTEKSSNEIWGVLEKHDFKDKNAWQMSFFQVLPDEYVDPYTYELLIAFLKDDSDKDIRSSPYRNLRFLDKFIGIDRDIYVTASRIIFEKRKYNGFIVWIYFACLFHESYYSPEELISRFASDKKLLKDIFFFTIKNNRLVDYNNLFLIAFLGLDDSWIDDYAEMIYERIQNHNDWDYDQFISLWKQDDYMKYFDRIFDRISDDFDVLYGWRVANAFKAILAHGRDDQDVLKRQKQWVSHIVEKYAEDNRIVCFFAAITKAGIDIRKSAFQKFFECNDNYELFEKLQLDSNHWGGEEREIISDLQNKIEFLESLLPCAKGAKYLKHAKRIRDRIDFWKAQIEKIEIESICRNLYK